MWLKVLQIAEPNKNSAFWIRLHTACIHRGRIKADGTVARPATPIKIYLAYRC